MLFVTVFLAFFAAIASAMPLRVGKMIAKRDVWAPKVLSPTEGSVWMVGDRMNVTWDTTNPPRQITNPIGKIILRNTAGFVSGPGSLNEPLASEFQLSDGWVAVEVPNVPAGDDYQIVLFGDSGNESSFFKIVNPIVQAALAALNI